ncbi:hypothetical protein MTO96_043814 [Rhipicephalus appendiculatus]
MWIISVHQRDSNDEQFVLPGALPSRAEAIEFAKLVNDQYGSAPNRRAHVIHICPWASNYCRCKPLHGIPIKRRTRPSKLWRTITERHFSNLIEYITRHPRQLCLFEVGRLPVHISLC